MPPSLRARDLLTRFRQDGFLWLARAVFNRLVPPRLTMRSAVLSSVRDRKGLEIGGPSRVFASRGLLPIYTRAGHIDNVNFSAQTAWENDLCDGGEFRFDPSRRPGTQWIRDAVALNGINDASYDFILSSHCLEHVANPLRALHEWGRITRPGGYLVLLLPDPKRSFDHRRPITTLEHLREDFTRGTGDDDTTHIPEVLSLHDLARDPRAGSAETFRARVQRNVENRCLHHHVFDLELMNAALRETGWSVLASETARPIHLVALARKPATG